MAKTTTALMELVELEIRKESLEKVVCEARDKIGEQKLKLQRAQRDVTDYSGRLKYGGKGGIHATDVTELRQKESQALEAVSYSEKQLAKIEVEAKSAVDDLAQARNQTESILNHLKMRYCSAAQAADRKSGGGGDSARGKRDDDGGGSKQPIAASFSEHIQRVVDELKTLLIGGGHHPFLKLFVNGSAPINDAAPHFSSWEQRTLTCIFTARETLQQILQRIVDTVNMCATTYPDLAKNTPLWTEFVDGVDASFQSAVVEVVDRSLFLYERALGGKAAPELFSVNLKLTAANRLSLVPSAHDLPNMVTSLIEEKLFSIVPTNTIADVVSVGTSSKSGKGVPLKKILANKDIASKLETIRNHVARYGEELVSAVCKVEDRFQRYWTVEECNKLTLESLRAARDEVEFDFGAVRQRMFGGAFQLNCFPLQDTVISTLTSQIEARRVMEANTSDEVIRQMIKTSTLEGARTWSVPPGTNLASLLHQHHHAATAKKSGSPQKGEEWSDRFDPVKFVEQLVVAQTKSNPAPHDRGSAATDGIAKDPQQHASAKSDASPPAVSKASSATAMGKVPPLPASSTSPRGPLEAAKENVVPVVYSSYVSSSRKALAAASGAGTAGPPSATEATVADHASSPNALPAKALGPLVSPRPSSTPSSGVRGSVSQQLLNASLTPNRLVGKAHVSPHDAAVPPSSLSIRSQELLRGTAEPSTIAGRGAWDETSESTAALPGGAPLAAKRERPRSILDLPPREPDHAIPPTALVSPFREKQVSSSSVGVPPAPVSSSATDGGAAPARELSFGEAGASSYKQLPQIGNEERRPPRSILKPDNTQQQQQHHQTAFSAGTSHGATMVAPLPKDDEDEYTLQRLLQKEKESLERIRLMKERDEVRRKEIQAAHRKAGATDETLRKVSPRSEYQQLLEEQARLDAARRENEIKLREAEREARRVREEQEAQRLREADDEERQQREWEEQLRRQHEENARRRAKEKQLADEAEREALRKKMEEDERRRQYQRELEGRLEEELRRRALHQQKEREEREQERIRRDAEIQATQEAERVRQRAAMERMRSSPPPRDADTPTSQNGDAAEYFPSVSEASALRRKLSLPPVQSAMGAGPDSRPATPPTLPAPGSARTRKPNTAPQGTPRGNVPPSVARSTTSLGAAAAPGTLPTQELTPRDKLSPVVNGPLPERSLLDEYKQYCLNFGIKPNSGLLKSLPSVVGDFATTINLDLNYIGVKGVQPLLQILKRNRGLKLLNLKDNNLENNEVRALVTVLLSESGNSLTHLDLSNNPISLAGGSAIMDLVTNQKSLTTVVLRGTLIQPKVVEKIVEAAEANRRRAAWNAGSD